MVARTTAALFCCSLFAGLVFAQDTSEIEGSVINSATRTGIPGVAVKVFTQLGVRYETTTNAQGQFNIRGLKTGDYGGSFERDGFALFGPSAEVLPKRLHVDGKAPARLDVEMVPFGRISGRVVDAEGKPVADVIVTLDGPPTVHPPAATTSADGEFAFDKLMPGSFTILAKPKLPAHTEETRTDRVGPIFTYFPSARDRRQAAPIVLRAGADVSGNEIRLRSVPVHRLRGVVIDDSGRPASGAIVSLRSRDAVSVNMVISMLGPARTWYPGPGPGVEAGNTQTGADGKFEFASVGDGDWLVHAETPWTFNEETRKDLQALGDVPLSVSQKDLDDVQVHLTNNFDLPLQIDSEEGSEAKGPGNLMVILAPVDGTAEVFGGPGPRGGKPVIDRAYPGRYRVLATTSRPGYYVASIDYGGRPINGPIDIAPGAQPLHFLLRRHAGVVRGTIEKGAAAMVVLAAAGEPAVVYGVPSPGGGSFGFDNLRPGSYAVAAFDHIEDQKLSDPAFVASMMRSAQTISVQEDANPAITLTVNRWPD
jgi:protocatechuate 3,4-dioxygenase beta subunit